MNHTQTQSNAVYQSVTSLLTGILLLKPQNAHPFSRMSNSTLYQLIQRESVPEFWSTAHKHYIHRHRCEDQHWVNNQIQKWGTDLHRHTTTAPQTQKIHLLLCSCFEQIHREVIILTLCKITKKITSFKHSIKSTSGCETKP